MRYFHRKLVYHYREGGVTNLFRKAGGLVGRKCWSESEWVLYVRDLSKHLPLVNESVQRRELGLRELIELDYFKAKAFPEEIERRFGRRNVCYGFYLGDRLTTVGWSSPDYLELDRDLQFPCLGAAGLFDFFTFEEFRSHGYYTNALIQLSAVMRRARFASAYIAVDRGNIASIKGIERAGFRLALCVTRRWRFGVPAVIYRSVMPASVEPRRD